MKNNTFNFIKCKMARAVDPASRRKKMALALTALMAWQAMATSLYARPMTARRASSTSAPAGRAMLSSRPSQIVLPKQLKGYVDMHTHPMSHLGFGKKLMHGAPDINMIIPKGTYACNPEDFRAKSIGEALGSCASGHGGWGLDNTCGDHLRAAIINNGMDESFVHKTSNAHGDHQHAGYPLFQYWPHQTSVTHQQMWWEWIKRAHEGGLSVMVALTVNNQLMAGAINGDAPKTDKASSDLQISEIKRLVSRHLDFMEIAYSPEDMRRIVGANKLAVILGMEIDDFGGFTSSPTYEWRFSNLEQKKALVKQEIQRVYDQGVRYLFPIHLTNNVFGGAAVYNPLMNFANKHNTGSLFEVETSPIFNIKYDVNFAGDTTAATMGTLQGLIAAAGELYAPCVNDISCLPGKVRCCGPGFGIITQAMGGTWPTSYGTTPPGHINKQPLTELGKFAMQEMMKKGMMIDLDHMGLKSTNDSLALAEGFRGGYPVNLGHNALRHNTSQHLGTERNLDADTIVRVARLRGMIGVGTSDQEPEEFITRYREIAKIITDNTNFYPALGIGTDVNGMEKLPKAYSGWTSEGFYQRTGITRQRTGERTWDYVRDDVAHYGLMKEWIADVKIMDAGKGVYSQLTSSAENFARMWETCKSKSDNP